jgi:anti-sigma factor (TIGR02949 family)
MIHQHSMNCKKILNNLSAYIDGELDEELCQQIETHLETCQECRIVVDTLKKTIDIYQKDAENTTLPSDARARLYACLALENDTNHDE